MWPEDATCWTREHRPVLVNPRLSTAFAFERDGESWWVDGAVALLGDCPAGYQRKLTERGHWHTEITRAVGMLDSVNKLIAVKGGGARRGVGARLPAHRRARESTSASDLHRHLRAQGS